jgi:cyclophilin family peptidyl-prolyl cis-trans isomerase
MVRVLSSSLLFSIISCTTPPQSSKWLDKQAPQSFKARFETTKGVFIVEFQRDWSPNGVDRAYQLIRSNFYDDTPIFRVVENYVAQFGINNDSTKNSFWKTKILIDEPVNIPNTEATISFARGGPDSRGTQLFINLRNNSPRLDTLNYQNVIGFPVIGKIIENKTVIDSLYSEYGNTPRQDSIQVYGNKYLKKHFPELDYIQRVTIIK